MNRGKPNVLIGSELAALTAGIARTLVQDSNTQSPSSSFTTILWDVHVACQVVSTEIFAQKKRLPRPRLRYTADAALFFGGGSISQHSEPSTSDLQRRKN